MDRMSSTPPTQHSAEPHASAPGNKLNWLRAGVLGANDGIVSTAGIVIGVAAASADRGHIFTAGLAGLTAAYELREHDVDVYEATDRIGGKLHTVAFEAGAPVAG